MILLAFLLPLTFYVLVLGVINRRPHPLLVSGRWDFVGLLFAASGFLVFGGPFVISTLNEKYRVFFLLGPHNSGDGGGDGLWAVWLVSSVVYFVLVLAGAAILVWAQGKQTAIYNIDLASFEEALAAACARLGLHPVRSGTSYLFDPAKDLLAASAAQSAAAVATEARPPRPFGLLDARQVVLMDVNYFRAMRHVTLRWSAADSLLRREVENELGQQLNETTVLPGEMGAWLTVLAFLMLVASLLLGLAIMVYRLVYRI